MALADQEAAKQKFIRFLGRKRLRLTNQRQAIITAVFNTTQHFTAEQLLEWSRQLDRSVSRATVYRTLPLLVESGLLKELELGKDYKYYDPNYAQHPHHNHIICLDCDKIVEFDSKEMDQLGKQISQKLGFSPKSQRLQITATCDEFRKTGFCTKKVH